MSTRERCARAAWFEDSNIAGSDIKARLMYLEGAPELGGRVGAKAIVGSGKEFV